MTDWHTIIPRISIQPPAVDFIDNRLPERLPAFANHNMRYDSASDSYVPRSTPGIKIAAPVEPSSNSQGRSAGAAPKPPDNASAMDFWNDIFDDAMDRFTQIPKRTKDKGYDIRCKGSWSEISAQLYAARDFYLGNDGSKNWLTGSRRKIADNIQPVIAVAELVPDIDYTAPVLGAVKVMLGVCTSTLALRMT